VIRNLVTCSRGGGNYLLNIGPMGDGSIPAPSVRILSETGRWLERNGESIFGTGRCDIPTGVFGDCTAKGNTLYFHIYYWPGVEGSLAGLKTRVKSARLLASGQPVKFAQDEMRVHFTGLPATAPDSPVTTLALECDGPPERQKDTARVLRRRYGVGIGS
jgi:alpha-L-fucosidase